MVFSTRIGFLQCHHGFSLSRHTNEQIYIWGQMLYFRFGYPLPEVRPAARLLCISILSFVICSPASRLPSLSESLLFVCNFYFSFHSDPFQYDPKKDLACTWDKSNCSVICTLFKSPFLGNGISVKNVLWPLTSFPDRHSYWVHSVQYSFLLLKVVSK